MKKVTLFHTLLFNNAVENVMVIDDDTICHLILLKNIELSGFSKKVTSFVNATEALNELRSCAIINLPDIIFLDINMPIMNGWEFLEEYEHLPHTLLSNTKIIMLSSSDNCIDIKNGETNKHVYDYIVKPIRIDKLKELMQKIILRPAC